MKQRCKDEENPRPTLPAEGGRRMGHPQRRMSQRAWKVNGEMSGCAETVKAAASRTPKVMREESWKVR